MCRHNPAQLCCCTCLCPELGQTLLASANGDGQRELAWSITPCNTLLCATCAFQPVSAGNGEGGSHMEQEKRKGCTGETKVRAVMTGEDLQRLPR